MLEIDSGINMQTIEQNGKMFTSSFLGAEEKVLGTIQDGGEQKKLDYRPHFFYPPSVLDRSERGIYDLDFKIREVGI